MTGTRSRRLIGCSPVGLFLALSEQRKLRVVVMTKEPSQEETRWGWPLTELKPRIRDVRQGPDELLSVLTEEDRGALPRIEPADPPTLLGRASE